MHMHECKYMCRFILGGHTHVYSGLLLVLYCWWSSQGAYGLLGIKSIVGHVPGKHSIQWTISLAPGY